MQTISCPHCGAANATGATFCGSCGKALPAAQPTGPRIVASGALATTSAGIKLQSDELQKQLKKATGALLAVAIIQTVFAGVFYVLAQQASRTLQVNMPVAIGTILAIAVVFWGLYFWARVNPLPAAIVGLVVFVTLWAIDVVAGVIAMSRNPNARPIGAGPFNGIVIKIIIVVILVRAVQAGATYRKLVRQQAAPTPAN